MLLNVTPEKDAAIGNIDKLFIDIVAIASYVSSCRKNDENYWNSVIKTKRRRHAV